MWLSKLGKSAKHSSGQCSRILKTGCPNNAAMGGREDTPCSKTV
jgi:hypothetical protein